jgi:large subunit ribosomal protein L29
MAWLGKQAVSVMKISEIRQLSDQELGSEIERLSRHLFDLRTQAVTEKLENPTMLGKTRRDIARIKTVQAQRQAQAVAGGQEA